MPRGSPPPARIAALSALRAPSALPPRIAAGVWGARGVLAHGLAFLSPQEQFEFALTAVAEEVNAILQALPQ